MSIECAQSECSALVVCVRRTLARWAVFGLAQAAVVCVEEVRNG
jgi:hypothetical protein